MLGEPGDPASRRPALAAGFRRRRPPRRPGTRAEAAERYPALATHPGSPSTTSTMSWPGGHHHRPLPTRSAASWWCAADPNKNTPTYHCGKREAISVIHVMRHTNNCRFPAALRGLLTPGAGKARPVGGSRNPGPQGRAAGAIRAHPHRPRGHPQARRPVRPGPRGRHMAGAMTGKGNGLLVCTRQGAHPPALAEGQPRDAFDFADRLGALYVIRLGQGRKSTPEQQIRNRRHAVPR